MQLNWQPTASLPNLQLRAAILAKLRRFFEERGVLEVETPLLCSSTATDPSINSFETALHFPGAPSRQNLFLQTSPEFPMKRLVAAGFGSIYQICKAFRNGESGKKHNPEFTILEWYRVDFTHHTLMDEINNLLQSILQTKTATRISYQALFQNYFNLNPHTCSATELQRCANKFSLSLESSSFDQNAWLDLLMTHIIEPELGIQAPIFIYDYPASQAALAKIRHEKEYSIGERFELYYKGIELANGYHELADIKEHQHRFNQDNIIRAQLNLPIIPIDEHLLNALTVFPSCAGVALGVDRLILCALESDEISETLSFPIQRA